MRPLYVASTALLAVLACQPATTFTDADREAISLAADAAIAAANARDWAGWIAVYADQSVIMPPNRPPMESRDATERLMVDFPAFRDLKLQRYVLDGVGDLAWVHGHYTITFEAPGPDSGKYLEIWRKQPDGSWKIIRHMFSSDAPPASAPALQAGRVSLPRLAASR